MAELLRAAGYKVDVVGGVGTKVWIYWYRKGVSL
jgi:hypothetical protein